MHFLYYLTFSHTAHTCKNTPETIPKKPKHIFFHQKFANTDY